MSYKVRTVTLLGVLLWAGCNDTQPDPCLPLGGVCKPVGSCAPRGSSLPSDQMGVIGPSVTCPGPAASAGIVCCLPLTACPDETSVECTDGSATYRPYCEGGSFKCAAGTHFATSPSYSWTQVSVDMKSTCATATACHAKGTTQPFSFDGSLTAGQDMANYTALMAVMPSLINKAAPQSSLLITVAAGGMYMGVTHPATLTTAKASSWTQWITAGATFP